MLIPLRTVLKLGTVIYALGVATGSGHINSEQVMAVWHKVQTVVVAFI